MMASRIARPNAWSDGRTAFAIAGRMLSSNRTGSDRSGDVIVAAMTHSPSLSPSPRRRQKVPGELLRCLARLGQVRHALNQPRHLRAGVGPTAWQLRAQRVEGAALLELPERRAVHVEERTQFLRLHDGRNRIADHQAPPLSRRGGTHFVASCAWAGNTSPTLISSTRAMSAFSGPVGSV